MDTIVSNPVTVPEGLNPRFLQTQPSVASRFLGAAGSNPAIYAILTREAGYSLAEHRRGWRLYEACSEPRGEVAEPPRRNPVLAVREEIERRQRALFKRVNATLRGKHPAQHTYLLGGLTPGEGVEAVTAVESLLDRIDRLATDPDRKATRKEDQAALAALAARGVSAALEKRLRRLIAVYKTPRDVPPPPPSTGEEQEHVDRLYALYVWLREWRELARAVVTRKDQLRALGIGRRSKKKRVAAAGPTGPVLEPGPDSRAA